MKRLVKLMLQPIAVVMIWATVFNLLAPAKLQAQQIQVSKKAWHEVQNPAQFGADPKSAFEYGGWKTPNDLVSQVCSSGKYLRMLKASLAAELPIYGYRVLSDAQAEELVQKVCTRQFQVVRLRSGDQYLYDLGTNGHHGDNMTIVDRSDFKVSDHRIVRVTMDDGFYIDLPDMCSNPEIPRIVPSTPVPPAQVAPPVTTAPPVNNTTTNNNNNYAPPAPVQPPAPQLPPPPSITYTCYDFFSGMQYWPNTYETRPFGDRYSQGSQFAIRIPDGLRGWHFAYDQFYLIRQGDDMRDINDRNLDPRWSATYNIYVSQQGQIAQSDPVDIPGVYTSVFPLVAPNGAYMECRVPIVIQGHGHHCGKTCKILIIAGAVAAVALGAYFLWPRGAEAALKTVGAPGPGR